MQINKRFPNGLVISAITGNRDSYRKRHYYYCWSSSQLLSALPNIRHTQHRRTAVEQLSNLCHSTGTGQEDLYRRLQLFGELDNRAEDLLHIRQVRTPFIELNFIEYVHYGDGWGVCLARIVDSLISPLPTRLRNTYSPERVPGVY
jgi:hypothetical protein